MGAKNESRTETRKKIQSEISTSITNITENITNVVNNTTNETMTSMVQEMKAQINISVGAGNTLRSKNIVASGSDVDIKQNADVQAENEAIIRIISDASAMQKLADKVAADVNNKLANDTAAKASMAQVAAIADTQKQAGGPEQMVDSIMKTVDGMVKGLSQIGGGSSDTNISETEIKNKIKTDIINKTTNRSDIANIVTNRIQNSMKQAAEAKCNMDTTGNNTIDVDNIVANAIAGERGSIKIAQAVSIKAVNKCFIDLKMGQGIVNDVGIDKAFTAKSDTTNTNKTDSASKQDGTITKTQIQESAIMSSVDNLVNNVGSIFKISPMMMMMVVGGGLAAALAAYFASSGSGSKSEEPLGDTPEGESGTQVGVFLRYALTNNYNLDTESSLAGMEETELFGGANMNSNNYGNIYLWAFLAVLVYYVYGKSLPMTSVLVIVIIGYIVYTIKTKNLKL